MTKSLLRKITLSDSLIHSTSALVPLQTTVQNQSVLSKTSPLDVVCKITLIPTAM